jgi:hypothetical protein
VYNKDKSIAIRQINKKWRCLFVIVNEVDNDIELKKIELLKGIGLLNDNHKNELLEIIHKYVVENK